MSSPLNRHTLAAVSPTLAAITEHTLFGDIWQRPVLSPRERSLITVAALIAQSRPQQLAWHLNFARQNGLSTEQLSEMMTHLAFYCGWPAAVSALELLNATGEA